ncbi:hypothetical protein LCGC14_1574670, partial [marine sediment metagenome]
RCSFTTNGGWFFPLYGGYGMGIVSLIKDRKADVVIVGSDQEYIRRAFLYVAQGLGIPTLLLDLGISDNITNTVGIAFKRTSYRMRYYFWNIIRKYLYLLRTVVDLRWNPFRILRMVAKDIKVVLFIDDARGMFGNQPIVVAGDWERKVLLERGVNPENIHIAGNPRWGLGSTIGTSEGVRSGLGIGEDDKIILFLTCAQVEHGRWTVGMRESLIKGVIDTLKPILDDSVHLIIKIHPIENKAEYEKMVGDSPTILLKEISLPDIINASDVVLVGGYSSTVLEASHLQKPVIILNTFNEIKAIPYDEMGIAMEVNDLTTLEPIVDNLLCGQPYTDRMLRNSAQFFKANKAFVDGKATERITDLIMELAGK